jgi:hypothetical protein
VDFQDPWRDFPGGNPHPYIRLSKFPVRSQYYFIENLNASPPTVQTWNLSIQRQLPASFLASITYLGSQATHLWVGGHINRAVYFPGAPANGVCTTQGYVLRTTGATCSTTANTEDRRRLVLENPVEGQYYGNLHTREDSGTQQYHGMLLSIQRRAASGVNVGGNYTWSHCTGIAPTANATGRGTPGYLDPNNREFDRGNCQLSDRRHLFNLTAVASTPQLDNPALRRLVSGWQLSGIYRISTGQFLTISTGLDRLLSGQAGNQRPVQVLGNPFADENSVSQYLNPNAFVQPGLGAMGNMRPFNVKGPGTWQLDLGLSRTFRFQEVQRLEFRAEAFNLTNSLRRGNPDTTLNSNTFGQITTSSDARIMQFALKYSF